MSRAWLFRGVAWCLLTIVSSVLGLSFAGGVNYPNLIPVEAVPLGHLTGLLPGSDFYHLVLSKSKGEIALLTLESDKFKSAYSSDSGENSAAEVVVDGDVVTDYEFGIGLSFLGPKACLACDGTLYVALRRGDPGGDLLKIAANDPPPLDRSSGTVRIGHFRGAGKGAEDGQKRYMSDRSNGGGIPMVSVAPGLRGWAVMRGATGLIVALVRSSAFALRPMQSVLSFRPAQATFRPSKNPTVPGGRRADPWFRSMKMMQTTHVTGPCAPLGGNS